MHTTVTRTPHLGGTVRKFMRMESVSQAKIIAKLGQADCRVPRNTHQGLSKKYPK